jgi:CelD/BcsL family acetyltransferase involved in cellulose biosynthesis
VSVDFDPEAVGPQWRELESSGDLTPFQTRAWLEPWYHILAPDFRASPIFVTVREPGSGRPLMLLPLCLRRQGGVLLIEFPDLGVSDYNAPLLANAFHPSEAELAALWRDIVRALPRADAIVLEKMPDTIAGRENPMARLTGAGCMRVRAWGIDLPKSRDAYDKQLKSFVRKELRRKRRNLENEGPLRFVHAETEAQAREIFEMHRHQRHARGTAFGGSPSGDTAYFRFYETFIFDNWASGFCMLSALMVGEEIGATLFALNHRGSYVLLMHCFETGRWGTKSPGIVAIDSAITDRIEAGATYFDFTVGNEPYKLQFAVAEKLLFRYERGLSARGRAQISVRKAKRFLGTQVRRLPRNYWPRGMRD